MPHENVLGEYLRARRELVRPGDAGVEDLSGRRRVAGLRRAEVALRAGVSTDYYVRLEQGATRTRPRRCSGVRSAHWRELWNSMKTPQRTCTASPTGRLPGAAGIRGKSGLPRES